MIIQPNLKWASASIICEETRLHLLLRDLGEYLCIQKRFDNTILYYIDLSCQPTRNVRIAFRGTEMQVNALLRSFINFVDLFFEKQNLFAKCELQSYASLFADFPLNSIQFGLFDPNLIFTERRDGNQFSLEVNEYVEFSLVVTNIIIEELSKAIIEDERILMLAYYLNLSTLKCVCDYEPRNNTHEFFRKVIGSINFDGRNNQTSRNVKMKYIENEAILLSIRDDFFNQPTTVIGDFPQWILSFYQACLKELQKMKQFNEVEKYIEIRSIICRQLGLDAALNLYLDYFISRVSESFL